jgi:hypothetical protein
LVFPPTGNANFPIGGSLNAIQENGVPKQHRHSIILRA